MELSHQSIEALEELIDGDGDLAPYKSGPELVTFFNDYDFDDSYGQGFPSRWAYTQDRLKELNGSETLRDLIEDHFHPINFLDTEFDVDDAVQHFNQFLEFDGYQLERYGREYRVVNIEEDMVEIEADLFLHTGEINERYIQEQITKCRRKVSDEDYDGAITNARSLLETILVGFEEQLGDEPVDYDGDLNSLFTRVRRLLNLDPSREDINDRLREILSGLISIVSGMAGLRNKMSDAHVRTYRPDKHHAKLAVNAVNTVCDFLLESYSYQQEHGLLTED